jgi:hypothetical protein
MITLVPADVIAGDAVYIRVSNSSKVTNCPLPADALRYDEIQRRLLG